LTRGARTSWFGVPVADHQPPPVLVALVGVRLYVRGDLGLQRGREHPPRSVPDDLVQHRPARRRDPVSRLLVLADYRKHQGAFPTRAGTRAFA
jgi:hypothetical protein